MVAVVARVSAMLVEFECPKCNSHNCERWALNSPDPKIRLLYLNMVFNPGLAFNELVLGQRCTEEIFVCKSCDMPMLDRTYVHCPNCDVFLPGRIWSYHNAFGNWFGYFCPSCGGEIPCIRNHTSRLIIYLTTPIWWLPVKFQKEKLMGLKRKQIRQAQDVYIDKISNQPKTINYMRLGLLWGLLMALFLATAPVLLAVAGGNQSLSSLTGIYLVEVFKALLIALPAGLIFGGRLKGILQKKGDKSLHLAYDSDGNLISSDAAPSVDFQTNGDV